jgi:hypothetical protein
MRRSRNAVLAMYALIGFAFPVFGQNGLGSGNTVPHVPHPYTAKFQITSEQRLANGTTITHESTEIVAVNSEGRRLTVTSIPARDQSPERTVVQVSDPVARTNTNWMVPGTSATVHKLPPPPEPGRARRTCWAAGAPQVTTVPLAPARAGGTVTSSVGMGGASVVPPQRRMASNERTREDLGTQTIQGVVASGTRMTRTTPAGAEGNDAPLVRVTEVWNAKSIGLMVREVTDDPRTGKRNKELVELSQSEPDPATFQPPEGYQVVTEEMHEVPCQQ